MRAGRWSWGGPTLLCAAGIASIVMSSQWVGWAGSPTWSSAFANVGSVFTWLPAALAGWSAWQGWRHKRADINHQPTVQSPLGIWLDWYLPAIVASAGFPLLALGWMGLHSGGMPRLVDMALLPAAMLMLLLWSMVGAALGRTFPLALSLPLATLIAFIGVAYPEAMSRFGIRHVAGLHSSCCLISDVIDWRVALAPLVFYAVAAGVVVALTLAPSWRRLAAAVVAIVVVFLGCLQVVRPVDNPTGTRTRDTAELVCTGRAPRVCLWPEQERLRPQIVVLATDLGKRLAPLGIDLPDTVTAADTGAWVYSAGALPRTEQVMTKSLIAGFVSPGFPDCASTQPWHMLLVMDDMVTWVQIAIGEDPAALSISPDLAQVISRPLDQQVAWFTSNFDKRSQCNVQPTR